MDTLPLPILISSIYKSLPPPDSNSNLKRTLDAFETVLKLTVLVTQSPALGINGVDCNVLEEGKFAEVSNSPKLQLAPQSVE